jgi:hypothetical protein
MSIASCLHKARALVAGGWTEPMPRAFDGRLVDAHDEAASLFDVESAVRLSAESSAEYFEALSLLESVACPNLVAFNALAERVVSGTAEVTEDELAVMARAAFPQVGGLSGWLQEPGRNLKPVLALFDRAVLRAKSREAA